MIKAIDELSCTNCGLCVNLCHSDVLRFNQDGKVHIAYPGDCHHCLECVFHCPYDAIIMGPGMPKKFNIIYRWQRIKDVLQKNA